MSGFAENEISGCLDSSLQRQANRNSYGNSRSYHSGRRQLRTLYQFRKFNAASLVVGVGAATFQGGAQAYCSVECIVGDR